MISSKLITEIDALIINILLAIFSIKYFLLLFLLVSSLPLAMILFFSVICSLIKILPPNLSFLIYSYSECTLYSLQFNNTVQKLRVDYDYVKTM